MFRLFCIQYVHETGVFAVNTLSQLVPRQLLSPADNGNRSYGARAVIYGRFSGRLCRIDKKKKFCCRTSFRPGLARWGEGIVLQSAKSNV